MAIEIQDTSELMGVLRNFPAVSSFWLDRYFRRSHFSQSEWVQFEEVAKGRRLAPFVAPNVQGQPMLQRAESIRAVKPAYLKPKDAVDPNRLIRRRAGESLGGSMTLQEREDAIVVDILGDHDEMIRRRWEWMACEAATKGQVVIEGENYPSRTVYFNRKPGNTIQLSGGSRWGESGANMFASLRQYARQIFASGTAVQDLIMGVDAADLFFADTEVKDALETRRGSKTTLELYNVSGSPVTYNGTLEGGLNLFTYNDVYENNDGVEVPFIDPLDAIFMGDIDGVRAFGAIMDRKAGWASQAVFPKMWEQDDPSGLFLMTQSAPIMVPVRTNASMRVRVR